MSAGREEGSKTINTTSGSVVGLYLYFYYYQMYGNVEDWGQENIMIINTTVFTSLVA